MPDRPDDPGLPSDNAPDPPGGSPRRWRLVLGSYAERSLGNCLGGADVRMDRALDHVYGAAYGQRGIRRALSGARRPGATGSRDGARDIAWAETIRRNLANWDPERRVLVAERLRFHGRVRRHLPWTIVLCVDQSGSMASSVIYAAVMAAILAGLPAVSVRLVLFDTAVVDLTGREGDPVDVLMSVQLGGGTDIGKAMAYCEAKHVTQPARTILVLVSDFCEGASPAPLLATVRRLAGARVTLLGLAALDEATRPDYDRAMAGQLADAGMHVAALTPEHFANWVAARIR